MQRPSQKPQATDCSRTDCMCAGPAGPGTGAGPYPRVPTARSLTFAPRAPHHTLSPPRPPPHTRRELELAVCDEKYPTAARLRDERALLLAELPAARVLLLRHLTALKEADHSGQGSAKRMRAAIAALSSLADRAALPALFALLGDGRPEVAEAARSAMAAIRAANTPNTRACALAQRGSALLLALGCGSLRLGGGGERQEESTSDGGAPCIATAISSGAGGSTRASIEVHEAAAAALELFTDAITLDPSLAGAHMGRGCLLYRLGGYEQAAVDLETAVNLDPYHWPAMRLLALARGQLRQWHAARQALTSAAVRCPGLVQQDEYRATEAVLQQWEAANAAWRARFEAARDAALLEEGKRQLEEVVQASGSQGGGEAAAAGHGEAAPDHVPRPRPEEEVDGLGI